jgi:hypothetical protein
MSDDFLKLLTAPSMVVLVDCWSDFDSPREQEVMQNIVDFCSRTRSVKAIALSTYPLEFEEQVVVEEPWYSNSKDLFYDSTKWNTLRRIWEQTPRVESAGHTHEIIKNMSIRPDQTQFMLWNNIQLLYYCNAVDTSIENIFLLGFSWEICMRGRPVGWIELHNLNVSNLFSKKKQILSNLKCTLDGDLEFVKQVESPWTRLKHDFVRLDGDSLDYSQPW